MRLHSLEVTAFGSFGGTEHVDFDRLSDSGLFLLHGPTGAGKTTILDAVSYALFGKVPGVRNEGVGLRSHHAAGRTPTEVRLDVTLRSRRYRIMRRPRQLLPKQRGTGLREHAAKATVEELVAGEWVARAAKPIEADPLLQEQLHMAAEQFHQIVMLPQGDFARFLQATPEARRSVLEELFGTQRFADVEQWLKARADAAELEISTANEQVRRTLVAAATIAGTEPFPDDEPVVGAVDWLTELQRSAGERSVGAAAVADAARVAHEAAKARHGAAVELHDRQARHARAARERAALEARADAHRRGRATLECARRALPVLPLLGLLARAEARGAEAARQLSAARAGIEQVAPDLVESSTATLVARVDDVIGQMSAVDAGRAEEQQLLEWERELARIDQLIAGDEKHFAELTERRALLPAERARAQVAVQEARDAASRVDGVRDQLEGLVARHRAAVERDRLGAEVEVVADERRVLTDAAQAAYARELSLVDAQLATRAASLAAALEAGERCPVCGNREHPVPATASTELVTDAAVRAARAAHKAATTKLDRTAAALRDLEGALATARALAGEEPVEELATARVTAEQALAEIDGLAAAREGLEQACATLDAEVQRLDGQIEVLRATLTESREVRSRLDGRLADVRDRLVGMRAGFATLGERRDALGAERAALVAAIEAGAALTVARQAGAGAREQATTTAVAQGFADLEAARAAAVDESEIVQLEAAVKDHEKRVTELDGELAQADLVAASLQEPADLAASVAAAMAREREWSEAATAAASTRQVVDRLARRRNETVALLDGLAPLADDFERKRHLATLALGEDRQVEHRMRLSTYVLAARLEQVAAAASERLRRMSNDRYTIVHTDAEDDARLKGGLGLRVVDAWTSTEREPNSLSGGESFFTSLALALGVADVVAAESGGIQMETMFIDEGFGSLDDETLHHVMDVLDGLRAGGRTVGIVSHVSDMRSRVTAQLEVVKGSRGSAIRVTNG